MANGRCASSSKWWTPMPATVNFLAYPKWITACHDLNCAELWR
ncbi:MAG: hypothetical protein R6X34_01330 [Chloroflexota bacterium]